MRVSIEYVLEMRSDGVPWSEIERVAGLGCVTIRKRLVEAGYVVEPNRIPDETLVRAAKLRKQGYSWPMLGRATGHSSSGIRRALIKFEERRNLSKPKGKTK